ncbi:MAG: zinc ABC transporter substrate-binding protein [Dehalococcoides mccartyi]|jgi:ABC-type metal ion transport system, periplasmic component/surface adhesin|uniref:Cation ABC transporter substrate-binding protein n=2 Tax=root TaxID=1 RepID=A0A0V8M471_9CHLR|nr:MULTISPECIES: zinc ABC transporter substrate-binding protein [Dehalococcoides]AQU03014.1 zinc ABC transporter substrate-binding protein [Dehalococcoides mccartyi]AQU04331.1 zinc ABC transporter substrate-binding protein [Dehalococcoides mccartyi]KSV18568.1 zinc ABC transporter substrate-binding protein [Dehalococcoides mccartyi]MDP4280002.1 zinc ABC transporter substrate-binding protein [Dehalococcoides mccartyi]MEA4879382.1 zinc ABC transporter substrate-binding protein [Dehalococcoides mc
MKLRTLFLSLALGVTLLSSLLLAGCQEDSSSAAKLKIAVSIVPLKEFTQQIAGDKAEVILMVPPGAEPHTYQPLPSQMVDISQADMYVKLGSDFGFEQTWISKILALNHSMLMVDSSVNITLESSPEGDGADPHIWLSPRNAIQMVKNITTGLMSLDPENKSYYAANRDAYLAKLEQLDNEITLALSHLHNRTFLVFHPAWAYFARDYNLKELSIEIEGKEPTPQQMIEIIDLAIQNNISIVFASPQFSSRSAESIASEIGGQVIMIDPLAQDYIKNMEFVYKQMQEVMS